LCKKKFFFKYTYLHLHYNGAIFLVATFKSSSLILTFCWPLTVAEAPKVKSFFSSSLHIPFLRCPTANILAMIIPVVSTYIIQKESFHFIFRLLTCSKMAEAQQQETDKRDGGTGTAVDEATPPLILPPSYSVVVAAADGAAAATQEAEAPPVVVTPPPSSSSPPPPTTNGHHHSSGGGQQPAATAVTAPTPAEQRQQLQFYPFAYGPWL
jgi:hypothetical protein